ncbi:MAG: sel1 repeat family protein [Deltaproteobacteria bacterium]|nr:sel1 repeat family protein [Deltaproteobacteria bacterium]
MLDAGRGGLTPDPTRAARLFEQACDGGKARGCYALTDHVLARTPPEAARGESHLSRACDNELGETCVRLGVLLELALSGMPHAPDRAATLHSRACDLGALLGCTYLANLTYLGERGLERDTNRAVKRNERACGGARSEPNAR